MHRRLTAGRGDRQPEFTQLDIEMSFVRPEDIFAMVEGMMARVFREVKGVELETPFRRLSWEEAMSRYGTDKPDLRFGLELVELSDLRDSDLAGHWRPAASSRVRVPGAAGLSRKELDGGRYGAKGLAWIKVLDGEWRAADKFLRDSEKDSLSRRRSPGRDLHAGRCPGHVNDGLANLRLEMGSRLGLVEEGVHAFTWRGFRVKSRAYDLVLNGMELGGGSIRIHLPELQREVLSLLDVKPETVEEQFGFLLEALDLGAPPHGGIAFGVDRPAMLLSDSPAIRDTIAFPKSQRAVCMLTEAPTAVDTRQLSELQIKTLAGD